jgi:hypothetical protein
VWRTLRYVEPLSDVRTPLVDFFRILLKINEHSAKTDEDPDVSGGVFTRD